ncbi:hypothetical protein BH09ACT6_BH09ACT6_00320 [soil metagenome]
MGESFAPDLYLMRSESALSVACDPVETTTWPVLGFRVLGILPNRFE